MSGDGTTLTNTIFVNNSIRGGDSNGDLAGEAQGGALLTDEMHITDSLFDINISTDYP